MIDEAIRTQLQPILPAYLIDVAESGDFPFAVYQINTVPFHTKEGVNHYITTLELMVIDPSIATVRNLGLQVVAELNKMPGNAINNTLVQSAKGSGGKPDKLVGESDSQQAIFVEEINFTITHKNP